MAHRVMRTSLTQVAVQKLRNLFNEMDTDTSGSVSLAKFKEVCACLSLLLSVTSNELDAFCKPISLERKGPYCIRTM